MSLLDDMNAGGGVFAMAGATRFIRLRAKRKTNPYNPAQNEPDWSVPPDELTIMGALSSSSSTRTGSAQTPTTDACGKSTDSPLRTRTHSPDGVRPWNAV